VGLGGAFKWLFNNEHQRMNLIEDVKYLKEKIKSKEQRNIELEKRVTQLETNQLLMSQKWEGKLEHLEASINDIKEMLKEVLQKK
jgi:hypothetical protein